MRAIVPARAGRIVAAVVVSMLLATVALVVARGANAWYSTKYVDSESVPSEYTMITCCQASREWNKIWRPTPIYFCSHMPPDVQSYICSLWDNPIVDNRNAFNSWAHCMNYDSVTSYPTTCQTTHP